MPLRRTHARRASTLAALAVAVTPFTSGCGEQPASATEASRSATVAESDVAALGTQTPSSTRAASPSSAGASSAASPSESASSTSGSVLKLTSDGAVIVPDAAKAHTQQGAVEFVKFYYAVLAELEKKPQTGIVPQLSTEDCESCSMQEEMMRSLMKSKGHVDLQGARSWDFKVRDAATDQVIVEFKTTFNSGTRTENGKTKQLPVKILNIAVRAEWSEVGWLVGESGGDESPHK